jgi:hypothetical protein
LADQSLPAPIVEAKVMQVEVGVVKLAVVFLMSFCPVPPVA